MTPGMTPYPLRLRPIFKERAWGGRRLESLHKRLPADARIGESWELVDLPHGGAPGGADERSLIDNGDLRGSSLAHAIDTWGESLMGTLPLHPSAGGFPLLVKFLDATENLSVQAHPSAAYARSHPSCHLKTESWYVISAEPGATIYRGLRRRLAPDELREKSRSGEIVGEMAQTAARPGDLHHLPSGICHALGAGALVAEVQTPSDTTFRLYDWGRTDRELHTEAAIACVTDAPLTGPPVTRAEGEGRALLVESDGYWIAQRRRTSAAAPPEVVSWSDQAPLVWVCLAGAVAVSAPGEREPLARFRAGDTTVFPAALAKAGLRFEGEGLVLEIGFPIAMTRERAGAPGRAA